MEAQREMMNRTNALWLIDPTHTTIEFSIKNFLLLHGEGALD